MVKYSIFPSQIKLLSSNHLQNFLAIRNYTKENGNSSLFLLASNTTISHFELTEMMRVAST